MKRILLLGILLITNWIHAQNKLNFQAVEKFQNELNLEFASKEKTPLTPEDLANFKSLAFYPFNPLLQIEAKFILTPHEKAFEMKTTTTRKPLYKKYGEAHFTLYGKTCIVNLYQNIELSKNSDYATYLFLPFSDLTSGNESYIGGRYIDLKIPQGETIFIDFNTAYNPYCAYNPKYSCPKVPIENHLPIAINAGVKKFHD